MALAALLILIGLVMGLATGGSLRSLADTRFRRIEILLAGVVLQLAVTFLPWKPFEDQGFWIILIASGAAAAFMFFNRNLPGLLIASIGLALNVLVIALNHGMPVSERAIELAGAPEFEAEGEHTALGPDTKLPWLTDVIPIPIAGSVLSPGDLFLAVGLARLVQGRTKGEGELPVDGVEHGSGSADDQVVPQ